MCRDRNNARCSVNRHGTKGCKRVRTGVILVYFAAVIGSSRIASPENKRWVMTKIMAAVNGRRLEWYWFGAEANRIPCSVC